MRPQHPVLWGLLGKSRCAPDAILELRINMLMIFNQSEHMRCCPLIRLREDRTPLRPGFNLYHPERRTPSAGFTEFLAKVRDVAAQMDTG